MRLPISNLPYVNAVPNDGASGAANAGTNAGPSVAKLALVWLQETQSVTKSVLPNAGQNGEDLAQRIVATGARIGANDVPIGVTADRAGLPHAKSVTQPEQFVATGQSAGKIGATPAATTAMTAATARGRNVGTTAGTHAAITAKVVVTELVRNVAMPIVTVAGTPTVTAATAHIATTAAMLAEHTAMAEEMAIAATGVAIIVTSAAPIATDVAKAIAQDNAPDITTGDAGTITAFGIAATGVVTRAMTGIGIAQPTADCSRSDGIIRPIVRTGTAGSVSGSS